MIAWESARKKSRQLETQLYKKLQEFAQVQTALMNEAAQGKRSAQQQSKQAHTGSSDLEMGRTVPSSSSSGLAASSASSSSSSVFPGSSPLLQYESLVGDLDQLLQSFASTIDAMAKILADSSSGSGGAGGGSSSIGVSSSLSAASKDSLATDANLYLVSKARSVLQENVHEFRRTKQNIQAALARQELLSGAAERNSEGTGAAATRGRTEQLLREGRGLQHSLDRADDVIASVDSQRARARARAP